MNIYFCTISVFDIAMQEWQWFGDDEYKFILCKLDLFATLVKAETPCNLKTEQKWIMHMQISVLSHAWVWKPVDLGRGIQSCGYHGP